MQEIILNKYINYFNNYTNSFIANCYDHSDIYINLKLKIDHSKRVMHNCCKIAKSENIVGNFYTLSAICGLFHDIGRFEQYSKYKTFKDDASLYHGQLGVEVIEKENFFEMISPAFQTIIKQSVYNHGLMQIEKGIDNQALLFVNMVRDADKLDIFKIVANYYHNSEGTRNTALEYGLNDNNGISTDVLNLFFNKQLISKELLRSLDDFKIMQLAWIFDINFKYTKSKIINENYVLSILDSLQDTQQVTHISSFIKDCLYE